MNDLDGVILKSEKQSLYEATLNLLYFCNYNCNYCCNTKRASGKMRSADEINKIIKFFSNRPEMWHINILGGEVTTVPQFVELCIGLTEKHVISIVTNNSISKSMQRDFIDFINPAKVKCISCSLQPIDESGERLENFIERLLSYKNSNFSVKVTYVAVPDRLNKIPFYKAKFDGLGIYFDVHLMKGVYNGLEYPKAYTSDERKHLHTVLQHSDEKLILELSEGEDYVSTFGKLCSYGYSRISIDGDSGDISGCPNNPIILGNIYKNGGVSLYNRIKPCLHDTCFDGVIVLQDDFINLREEEAKTSVTPETYNKAKQLALPLANPHQNFSQEEFEQLSYNKGLTDARNAVNAGNPGCDTLELLCELTSSPYAGAEAWYLYGVTLIRGSNFSGEYEKAVECFDIAHKYGFSDFWVNYNRGITYSKIGDKQKALDDLRRVIQIEPTNEIMQKVNGTAQDIINDLLRG